MGGAHGVRGLFKAEVYCDSPQVLAAQKRVFLAEKDGTFSEHKITSATPAGAIVLLGIEGIDSREEAVAQRGRIFYLHRDDIPLKRGAFFIADLIGVDVKDADTGKVYGTVESIDDVPQGQLFTVKTPSGARAYIPRVKAFIRSIDPDEGVLVTPIPGLFPEEDA